MPSRRFALLASLVLAAAAPIAGCAAPTETGSTEQHNTEATTFTKLGTSSAEDVSKAVEASFNEHMDKLLAAKDIEVFERGELYHQTAVGNVHYMDLSSAIEGIMEAHEIEEATPDFLRAEVYDWAMSWMETNEDGHVVYAAGMPLIAYRSIRRANRDNAFARAENPEGVDLVELEAQWAEVTKGSMLDHDFLLPVQLDKYPKFSEIRKYVHGGWVEDYSWGHRAVDDFWQAWEGPEGDPDFEPIAEALGGPGIERRWYMFDAGYDYGPWTRNYLVVVDEHLQMYGFMMGYSE